MILHGWSTRLNRPALAGLLLALGAVGGGGCGADRGELPAYTGAEIQSIEAKAGAGDAEAAHLRGVIEQQGLGIRPDAVRAAEWYQRADRLGHPTAGIELGLLYLNGDGVPKDVTAAVRWFRPAADRGRADAQYYLARQYEQGEGVARDEVQALKWFRLASRGQPYVKEAPVEAEGLARRLTPEQIAEAERQAKAFQARPVGATPAVPAGR